MSSSRRHFLLSSTKWAYLSAVGNPTQHLCENWVSNHRSFIWKKGGPPRIASLIAGRLGLWWYCNAHKQINWIELNWIEILKVLSGSCDILVNCHSRHCFKLGVLWNSTIGGTVGGVMFARESRWSRAKEQQKYNFFVGSAYNFRNNFRQLMTSSVFLVI